jgi:hypothetical protein
VWIIRSCLQKFDPGHMSAALVRSPTRLNAVLNFCPVGDHRESPDGQAIMKLREPWLNGPGTTPLHLSGQGRYIPHSNLTRRVLCGSWAHLPVAMLAKTSLEPKRPFCALHPIIVKAQYTSDPISSQHNDVFKTF